MIRVYYEKMHLSPEKIAEEMKKDGYSLSVEEIDEIIRKLKE